MLISLNWIREYVDLPEDLTMDKLSYDLTMRTVEVEGTYNPADGLENIVAGKILEVKPHPQVGPCSILRLLCSLCFNTNRSKTIAINTQATALND